MFGVIPRCFFKTSSLPLLRFHDDLQYLAPCPPPLPETVSPCCLFIKKSLWLYSLLDRQFPSLPPSAKRSLSCLMFFDIQPSPALRLQIDLFGLQQKLRLSDSSLLIHRFEYLRLLLNQYTQLSVVTQLDVLLQLVQQSGALKGQVSS